MPCPYLEGQILKRCAVFKGMMILSVGELNEYCTTEFVQDNIKGKQSSVLKLKYKLTAQDYNGYYSKLNGIDITPFTTLEFYIKGGDKFPSVVINPTA